MTAQPAIVRVRKRPVEVEAVQWTGDNAGDVYELAGCDKFDVLDEQARRDCDDPDATAAVFDELHSTWILVYDGDWIIRGTKGELYPNRPDVFRETYEDATAPAVTITTGSTSSPAGQCAPDPHPFAPSRRDAVDAQTLHDSPGADLPACCASGECEGPVTAVTPTAPAQAAFDAFWGSPALGGEPPSPLRCEPLGIRLAWEAAAQAAIDAEPAHDQQWSAW